MTIKLVRETERQPTKDMIVKTVRKVPRCAAMTQGGAQCSGTFGGTGTGGNWVEIDGERVPLCTVHSRKAGVWC